MAATIAKGAIVADPERERHGGRVTRIRSAWVDIEWPDGTRSTYGLDAARVLVIETPALFDVFGLGLKL